MNKKRLFGYLFVLVSVGNISAQESRLSAQEYKLWYDRPAQVWTEALPLGNGRLGAMVYGTPATEQIQLNEEPSGRDAPTTTPTPMHWNIIPRIRDLVFSRANIWKHRRSPPKRSWQRPIRECPIKALATCGSRFPDIPVTRTITGN